MLRVARNRWAAGALTGALVAASTLMIAGPASAAPGDASAVAAEGGLTVDIADVAFDVFASAGDISVTNPGSAADQGKDTKYFEHLRAVLTSGTYSTTADSTTDGSSASAELTNASFRVLGYNVITFTSAAAEVACPTDGEATAAASLGGLTVLDQARTLSVELPTAEATVDLQGDFLGATLTVQVEQIATTGTSATATALDVRLLLNGNVNGAPVSDLLIGSMTLASATCEAPAPPPPPTPVTATAIDPTSGPTAGGQTATITGSGFGVDTTVTFDGNLAVIDAVSEDGTELTLTTPAGEAGPAEVTVSKPGSSAVLAYEYIAAITPTAPPIITPTVPAAPITPATSSTDTLANTGADSSFAPVLAGALLLLTGSLTLAFARRRANA